MRDAENALVCAVRANIYDTGGEFIWVRQTDGATIPITPIEAHVLSRVSTAKTVDEWLEALCGDAIQERLMGGKHPFLGRVLEWLSSFAEAASKEGATRRYSHLPLHKELSIAVGSLIENGLLLPVERQVHSVVEARTPLSMRNCRITTLCIPTCGRSEYFSRCINSFFKNLHSHGRDDSTILVVDDSADRKTEIRNRDVVTSLHASDGPSIQFIGYEERKGIIDALLRKDVAPPNVLRFALSPDKLLTTVGSVRNTMMLLTGGQYVLQADDDTFCAYASANTNEETITVSDEPEPYQTYFFPDRESNLKKFPTSADIDPFAIHESVLGKPLSRVLKAAQQISWIDTNPHDLLDSQEDIQADITTTGASGDPGVGSCIGFLTISPVATLKRVYSGPEAYRVARESREVLRIVPNLTLSQRASLITMSFGINNTRLQPPFFPLGRSQDSAFAYLRRLADSRSLTAHLPFAVSHVSEQNRHYIAQPVDQASRLLLTDLVQLCLGAVASNKEATMSQNLRSIGEQLIGLTDASGTAFRSLLRHRYIDTRIMLAEELQGIAQRRGWKNKEWLNEMESFSTSVQQSLLDDTCILPTDLARSVGSEESLHLAQAYIRSYGTLLLHWEDITDVSGQICRSREEAPASSTANRVY